MRRPIAALALVLLLSSVASAADVERNWSVHYAEHLPEWCKFTMELPDPHIKGLYGDPRGQPYRDMFGDAFMHLHHYCRGVYRLYEAATAVDDEGLRRTRYSDAIKEFDYVLDRTGDSFALAPDMHFKKGIALMSLGLRYDAIRSFTHTLQIQPGYVAAYLALSEYFEDAGEHDEAVRLVREGLTHVPSAPALQERLAKLEASEPDRPH